MKIRKLTGAILALAMIAGMQGCADEEEKPTEATTETTTEAITEVTTEETTKETEATEESEPTELTTESQLPDIRGIVSVDDCGYGSIIQMPVINIESKEIDELNRKIRADLDNFIGDNSEYMGDYYIRYCLYSGKEGIHSIIIDYSYCGWDGFYRAYTFTDDGHVLGNEEVIELAGISKSEFSDKAFEATAKYMNDNFSYEGIPIVVEGKLNPENGFVGSEDNEMIPYMESTLFKDFNLDMTMMINDEGKLCICNAIMPIADYHDCEVFYSIPDGTKVDMTGWY